MVLQNPHELVEKNRAGTRCCGLALPHGLVLNIGLSLLHLSPLVGIVQEKVLNVLNVNVLSFEMIITAPNKKLKH